MSIFHVLRTQQIHLRLAMLSIKVTGTSSCCNKTRYEFGIQERQRAIANLLASVGMKEYSRFVVPVQWLAAL